MKYRTLSSLVVCLLVCGHLKAEDKPKIPTSELVIVIPVRQVDGEWLYKIKEASSLEIAEALDIPGALYALDIFKIHIAYRSLDNIYYMCEFPTQTEGIMWKKGHLSWKNKIQKWY